MSNQKKIDNVAVAIDKDKGSQFALKWAVDNLLGKGKNVTLLHVKQRANSLSTPAGGQAPEPEDASRAYRSQSQIDGGNAKELFLPFRCFCTRKDIQVSEVLLEDIDVAKALCDYVKANVIDTLVVGASTKGGFVRKFKSVDIPGTVTKGSPDYCTVYVIAKGKVASVKNATTPPPRSMTISNPTSPLNSFSNPRVPQGNGTGFSSTRSPPVSMVSDSRLPQGNVMRGGAIDRSPRFAPRNMSEETDSIKSPFMRGKAMSMDTGTNSDISFVSSGRPSFERMVPSFSDNQDMGYNPRLSNGSDTDINRLSFGSGFSDSRASDANTSNFGIFSSSSMESGNGHSWTSSQNQDEVEAEMRRLKLELKQTMDMYSSACKEALSAKQSAMELNRWKNEEQNRVEEAKLAEEAALAMAENEKLKCKAAIEAAEAAQRIAELESHKRKIAEMKAHKESEEKKKALSALAQNDVRYRKYSIEEVEIATENFSAARKVGEGGYGPVYKCYLDHTSVAIKVLRPDAAQGMSQFQQEVEVLSCIRHPNMVLLLGACPEYGCLVYEYMSNGSLDDCLFNRGKNPPLPWQLRFRIAAEIGTGLLFLHQSKPEPLVHRDLKPGNILLDRNFVSKISDVGLARLVPPNVAETVTQYRMTSTAGTFCYIDPEYQQTGMLGTKSDVYSLGIMLLQIITAKPPMGLTHHVERSIERGTFAEMLDPAVSDWPIEEALSFAKLALKCAELRRKDRPDLGKEVLPELNRLKMIAEESMPNMNMYYNPMGITRQSPSNSQTSDPHMHFSGYDNNGRSTSSLPQNS